MLQVAGAAAFGLSCCHTGKPVMPSLPLRVLMWALFLAVMIPAGFAIKAAVNEWGVYFFIPFMVGLFAFAFWYESRWPTVRW